MEVEANTELENEQSVEAETKFNLSANKYEEENKDKEMLIKTVQSSAFRILIEALKDLGFELIGEPEVSYKFLYIRAIKSR